VLARYVTEELASIHSDRLELENGGPFQIAYFFFNDRGERVEKTLAGMVRALLYQVLHSSPSLLSSIRVKDEFEKLKGKDHGFEWPLHAVKDLFLSLKNQKAIGTFYLIIDSLDESDAEHSASEVLEVLQELCSGAQTCNFKVFLTSRPETFLTTLDKTFEKYPRIWLESEDIKYISSDIQVYVLSQTAKLSRHRQEELGPLMEAIIHRAEGVFLWVDLVMKKLMIRTLKGDNLRELEKVVENLPSEMGDLYRKILRDVEDRDDIEERRVMLQWVLFAERPLTLSEFQAATKIEYNCSSYTSEAALVEDMQRPEDLKRRIRSRTGGLLEFKSVVAAPHENEDTPESEDRSTIVQLIHQSAKDFLFSCGKEWLSAYSIESGEWSLCHSQLALTCLKYLSFREFEMGPTQDVNPLGLQYKERLRKHRLLLYDAVHWPNHTYKAPQPSPTLWSAFCKMKMTPLRASLAFQVLQLEHHGSFSQTITALHIMSEFGLSYFVSQILLQEGADINAKASSGQTALHFAAESGHEAVALLLLDYKAYVGSRDDDERTALHLAARAGSEAVVRLLLEHNADPDAKANDNQTALHIAAERGDDALARLLLEHKTDPNAKTSEYKMTALLIAAERGHEAVTRLLLEYKADPNAKVGFSGTALHIAARGGREVIVRLLLEYKADPDAKAGFKGTALHIAAERGDEALARLLLEHQANPNINAEHGWRALHIAAESGHKALAQMLLEHNADPNAKAGFRGTSLHIAAEQGDEAVVRLLLEHNADPNAKAGFKGTSLHIASGQGHEAVAALLLDHKADVGWRDDDERTALHLAARAGSEAVVRLLLEHKADVGSRDDDERTALHLAARGGSEAVVRLLLEHKADVEAKDKDEQTALYIAAEWGDEAVVRLLLEYKADPDAKSSEYKRAALLIAAEHGHEAVALLLLDYKADVGSRDDDERTALHLAARAGSEAVVRLLLENKTDPNVKDRYGRTALHEVARGRHWVPISSRLIAEYGHEAVVRLLLEYKADPNAQDNDGQTAVQFAVKSGREAVVQILLKTPPYQNI
jgi:ankyrin repeat protein